MIGKQCIGAVAVVLAGLVMGGAAGAGEAADPAEEARRQADLAAGRARAAEAAAARADEARKRAAMGLPPEAANARPARAVAPQVAQVIALLDRPWHERIADEQWDQAAESVRKIADEAVVAMEQASHDPGRSSAYRHRMVRVLQRLGTPEAQRVLLQMSLGGADELPSMHQWASQAYVATLKDKAQARSLLGSPTPGVIFNGLRAIHGSKLDALVLKRLVELATDPTGEPGVRLEAASVMAADPVEQFADEKVRAIIAAMALVARSPDAEKIQWPGSWTIAEAAYWRLLKDLGDVRGGQKAIAAARATADGAARDLLAIRSAMGGDAASRAQVLAIIANPDAGMRRAWAVASLVRIGQEQDLAMLRKLAESDPMERDQGGCVQPPGGQSTYFPVREAAKQAVDAMTGEPKKPQAAAEGPWGAAADGFSGRLRPTAAKYQAVVTFYGGVRNEGPRECVVNVATNACRLEVDEHWYRWLEHTGTEWRRLGKGQSYEGIWIGVDAKGWAREDNGAPLALPPGKHTMRAEWLVEPRLAGDAKPVRVVSEAVEVVVE